MSVRPLLRMGDARLLDVAEAVADVSAPEIAELLQDMRDTMQAHEGAGLAAPQIGASLRVVIFGGCESPRYPDSGVVPYTELINPHVEVLGGRQEAGLEGCLSVPGLRGEVPRFVTIRYTGLAPDGQGIDRVAEGFHARVVQHEVDLLDGILYPQRMTDMRRFGFEDVLDL